MKNRYRLAAASAMAVGSLAITLATATASNAASVVEYRAQQAPNASVVESSATTASPDAYTMLSGWNLYVCGPDYASCQEDWRLYSRAGYSPSDIYYQPPNCTTSPENPINCNNYYFYVWY